MTATQSLEQLPVEIRSLILKAIPDISTLFSFISVSPHFLHPYLLQRDQILIAVVCNQLGENLPKGLCSIHPHLISSTGDLHSLYQPSFNDAKLLYKQDRLIDSLIEVCVDMQLETKVELRDVELARMRRGFYNLNFERLCKHHDSRLDGTFTKHLAPKEILETYFVIHCLRELAKEHIMRLEDLLVDKILDNTLQPRWYPEENEFIFFGSDQGWSLQSDWLHNAPWLLGLQEFYDLTLPVDLTQIQKFEPDWDNYMDRVDHEETMYREIPPDYRFDESSFPGIGPSLQFREDLPIVSHVMSDTFKAAFWKLLKAIPLGYMIWDESRLNRMWWKDHLPLALRGDQIKEKWRQHTSTVEHRVCRLQIADVKSDNPTTTR